MRVFNCTSGSLNPANLGFTIDESTRWCRVYPSVQTLMYPDMVKYPTTHVLYWQNVMHDFVPAMLLDGISRLVGQKAKALKYLRFLYDLAMLSELCGRRECE